MHTPQSLLEESDCQNSFYLFLKEQFPLGTFHPGRDNAYEAMISLAICAQWMKTKGHTSLAHVGPFYSEPFNFNGSHLKSFVGAKFRIKSGANIRCSNPKKPRTSVISRSLVVTPHKIYDGVVTNDRNDGMLVRQAEVVWYGSDGYRNYADLNDVELIIEKPVQPPKQKSEKWTNRKNKQDKFVFNDNDVEILAREMERFKRLGYEWTPEQFDVWWKKDEACDRDTMRAMARAGLNSLSLTVGQTEVVDDDAQVAEINRLRLLLTKNIGATHQCRQCFFSYTLQGAVEDCPQCGHDGVEVHTNVND